METILEDLRALSRRHDDYGVREEHYASVGAALLWTLGCGEQKYRSRVCGSVSMPCDSAAVRRDLPIPGSPETSTTRPSPDFACCQRRNSRSSSSSRPTRGVVPERNASKRLTTPLSPITRQARCGSAKPASGWG